MTNTTQNNLLRKARLAKRWTQADLAGQLGVTAITVGRWERGNFAPTRQNIMELSLIFGKKPQELGFFSEQLAQERPPLKGSLLDPMIPLPSAQSLIGRDGLQQTIQQHLLTSGSPAITLHGLPDVGKTTLALSLVSNQRIQEAFPDGILWAGLGPHPNIPEILSRWGALLGIAASGMGDARMNDEARLKILRATIGTRRILLILDDLWEYHDALALKVGGPRCAYIATTRSPQIAVSFAMSGAINIPELSEEHGITLLEHLAPAIKTYGAE